MNDTTRIYGFLKTLFIIIIIVSPLFTGLLLDTKVRKPTKEVLAQETQTRDHPKTIVIPRMGVDAAIEPVGVAPDGNMEAPVKPTDVGWFNFGPRPGEIGTAVIAGHLNDKDGKPAVFADLRKLRNGDRVYITYDNGPPAIFTVKSVRTYDTDDAKEVFNPTTSIHLNLITCDGIWDAIKKSYTERLVVFTEII